MEYQGFHTIREYEAECARLGHSTRRVPFHKGHENYFALISSPPGHPTGTSVESWTLFTADESRRVLDGVINGHHENYLGKLAAHGYYPEGEEAPAAAPPVPAPAPALEIAEDGGSFPQFSFFSA